MLPRSLTSGLLSSRNVTSRQCSRLPLFSRQCSAPSQQTVQPNTSICDRSSGVVARVALDQAPQAEHAAAGLLVAGSSTAIQDEQDASSSIAGQGQQPRLTKRQKRRLGLLVTETTESPTPTYYGHNYETCMQAVLAYAGVQELPRAVEHILSSSRRPDDNWLWISCGNWLDHPANINHGRRGPAFAILQLWQVSDHFCDYVLWEIGPDNVPTGQRHNSATAFETLTDLAIRKKYLCAFKVLNRADGGDGKLRALESWMARYIGNKVKLLPKNVHGSSWVPRVLDNGRVKRTTQDKRAAAEERARAARERAAARHGKSQGGRPLGSRSVSPFRRGARQRLDSYIGWGKFPLGPWATAAMSVASSSSAAAAAEGAGPDYVWPESAPQVLPPELNMGEAHIHQRDKILQAIAAGAEDLRHTHVPLQELLECLQLPQPSSSSSSGGSSRLQQVHQQVYRMEDLQAMASRIHNPNPDAAVLAAAGAAAAVGPDSSIFNNSRTSTITSAQQPLAARAAYDTSVGQSSDAGEQEQQQQIDQQQQQLLQQMSQQFPQHQQQWLQDSQGHAVAVVPDPTQPFTLTMHNPADGKDYVVAHYEPYALQWRKAEKAAMLAQIYHERHGELKMNRVSAQRDQMVLAGMRLPRTFTGPGAHYGRYSGDDGPEPDQFSLACWPDLATAGGFRAISSLWADTLPGLACTINREAGEWADTYESQQVMSSYQPRKTAKGPPANYPIPSLYGSPFTTLAVTQNYASQLHAEPAEHPFSYIAWLDVLSSGSQMQVAYFWLTNGLAFTPLSGSALYIDTRLVPHCSEPCYVYNARSYVEGRYGVALFIKPVVHQANSTAWAAFDEYLQNVRLHQEKEKGTVHQAPSNETFLQARMEAALRQARALDDAVQEEQLHMWGMQNLSH